MERWINGWVERPWWQTEWLQKIDGRWFRFGVAVVKIRVALAYWIAPRGYFDE